MRNLIFRIGHDQIRDLQSGFDGAIASLQPSVDAIQETAIQTSNYAAEYGQAGGGLYNITMKSGTNQYHGGGFDYLSIHAGVAAIGPKFQSAVTFASGLSASRYAPVASAISRKRAKSIVRG